jgi:hypothetical protein
MNAFLIGVRNFVFTIVLGLIGLYVVTLLQIQGTLPETEFSQSVIDEVTSKLENK